MSSLYEKADFYTKKAKAEGYFARSVYKLEEINKRFDLIKKDHKVLDLGCAPGSWSQYTSKLVGQNGLLVGIDYKKILFDGPNCEFIHGNFHNPEKIEAIKSFGPYDGVISDMAPDTTGDRLADCYSSSELVKDALNFAYENLKTGGYFIAKIFQGGDEIEIMEMVKKSFEHGKWLKPAACRKKSFETFIIGINFIKKYQPENNGEDFFNANDYSGEMPW